LVDENITLTPLTPQCFSPNSSYGMQYSPPKQQRIYNNADTQQGSNQNPQLSISNHSFPYNSLHSTTLYENSEIKIILIKKSSPNLNQNHLKLQNERSQQRPQRQDERSLTTRTGRIHNRIHPYHIPTEQNCRHNHTIINSSQQNLSHSCSYSCSATPHNHTFSVDRTVGGNSNMQNVHDDQPAADMDNSRLQFWT